MPYRAWLREPNRREFMNIGERWLRTTALVMASGSDSMAVVSRNTEKEVTCFKANGKGVKEGQWENAGLRCDDIGDKITKRDLRDSRKFNFMQKDKANESQLFGEGVIILDTKQCRMVEEHGLIEDNMDGIVTNSTMLDQANLKNLELAGSGSQACQTL